MKHYEKLAIELWFLNPSKTKTVDLGTLGFGEIKKNSKNYDKLLLVALPRLALIYCKVSPVHICMIILL